MRRLEIDGASLAYTISGTGPGLLVPWCNFPWHDTSSVDKLARRFTVLVAAPRGYASSTWLDDGVYDVDAVHDDLLAVCDAVGLTHVSVLGYSLTAAVALRLAARTASVDSVIAGGFPLFGDYALLRDDVRRRTGSGDDKEQDAELSRGLGFDVRAARAFYDDLATLPSGALIDDVDVPVFTFWGGADEVVDGFEGLDHLEAGVRARGIEHVVVADTDHATTLLALDGLIPCLTDWLIRETAARRSG